MKLARRKSLKRRLTRQEAGEARRLFDHFEGLLAETGGPYLFGALSLADLALVPTVLRLLRHQVPLPAHPLAEPWAHRLLGNPHVAEWLDEADRAPPIWYDDYLPPGETEWA